MVHDENIVFSEVSQLYFSMNTLPIVNFRYLTPTDSGSFLAKCLPTFSFYSKFFYTVAVAAFRAKNNRYATEDWERSSYRVVQALESVGVCIEVSGLEYLEQLHGPCVIVGNHMSMMETVILPAIVLPQRNVTFVVKESLLNYPVFKYVMRSCSPIAVTRTNPRQDLKTVMEEGQDRLRRGVSVIVFPQTTRSSKFDPAQFSTIAVKLALKAGVPVIPLALKTDAWTNGKRLKDFGRIIPRKQVHVAFGPPLEAEGKGQGAHEEGIAFIQGKLTQWQE